MLDYEIQRCTRRCAATDRELAPGEAFYSVLCVQGADIIRRDYAASSWSGPPTDCLGWWKSEVPDPRSTRVQWAPNDVLLDYFQKLLENEEKRDVAYILTLLLIRRRVFKLDGSEANTNRQESLLVFCPKNETEYRVPVVTPDAERAEQIQHELTELLFARGEPHPPASGGVSGAR